MKNRLELAMLVLSASLLGCPGPTPSHGTGTGGAGGSSGSTGTSTGGAGGGGSATTGGGGAGGAPCVPVDDGNPCTKDFCKDGMPKSVPKPDGDPCDDGNPCTQVDKCLAGVCTAGDPVACPALDSCHEPGECDPTTGLCSDPPKLADGTPCDDGDACTLEDSCLAGVCTANGLVACPVPDQCHDAGTCDPATGLCSDLPVADGTPCTDGDECTLVASCQGGLCAGISSVLCPVGSICANGTCVAAACGDGICADPEDCTTCPTDCGACLGSACTAGTAQCESGNCVDGVCCDQPCTETCKACSAQAKGAGIDGKCDFVVAGNDPDTECAAEAAPTCGNKGGCNGAGACLKYPQTTVCRSPTGLCDAAEACPGNGDPCPPDAPKPAGTVCNAICTAGTLTTMTCDGQSKACSTGNVMTTLCAPYICDGTGKSCRTSCLVDSECAAGNWCDPSHKCVPKLQAGAPCVSPNQCASGICNGSTCG